MLQVLYEDSDVIVAVKPPGVESQSARRFEPDMVSEIRKHIHKLSPNRDEPYVGVVHRLDKPVEGVMVYAKNPKAASALSRQIAQNQMKKEYLAVVCGKLVDKSGVFVDYLWKEEGANVSHIVEEGDKRGRRAELSYSLIENAERGGRELSLVRIRLKTGRHHQIRVQFAGHGYPLLGDLKYGPPDGRGGSLQHRSRQPVALAAYSLAFAHPVTGRICAYRSLPGGAVWKDFPVLYEPDFE